jgi:hypothetical protein
MGLGFTALAFSRATPWWITLARSSAWSEPLFAFYLKRYRNVAGASNIESDGGSVSFGRLGTCDHTPGRVTGLTVPDSSLYSGSITYVPVTDNSQYWEVPMQSRPFSDLFLVVSGVTLTLSSHDARDLDQPRIQQHGRCRYRYHPDWRPRIYYRIHLRRN